MKKENNKRRYPGENCNHRPDEAAKRRNEAQERQAIIDALTPQQRVENLDIKLGVGQGAKKERARLVTIAAKPPVQKTVSLAKATVAGTKKYEELEMQTLPDEVMEEIAALNEENNGKKKLKAKERRARESNNG